MTNPNKSAAMRARYAKLRAPVLEKMRALVAATPTLTPKELAPLLGINYATVRLFAKSIGLTLARGRSGPSPGYTLSHERPPVSAELRKKRGDGIAATSARKRAEMLERVTAALAAQPDASNQTLARAAGVSAITVARLLHAAGLRQRGRRGTVTADLTPALEAYRAGMRRDDVCREFHVGRARLMAAVLAAGIPQHKPTGRPPGTGRRRPRTVKPRVALPDAPVDQPREVSRWHTAKLRVVRVADGVLLASTNSPEKALSLCAFFGPGVEMRRAA